jgi:hypothetical protein
MSTPSGKAEKPAAAAVAAAETASGPVAALLLRVARQLAELATAQRLLQGDLHPFDPERPEDGGLNPMTREAYLQLQMQAAAFSSCSATAFVLFDIFGGASEAASLDSREAWPSLLFRGGAQHEMDLMCRCIRAREVVPRSLLDSVRSSHASFERDILPVLEAARSPADGLQSHYSFLFSLRDLSQAEPWATDVAMDQVRDTFKKLPDSVRAKVSSESRSRLLGHQARGRCSADHTFVVLVYPVPDQEHPSVLLVQSSAYAYQLHDWMALMFPELRRRGTCSDLTKSSTLSDPQAQAAVTLCHPHGDVRGAAQEELQKADAFRTPWVASDKKWKQFVAKLRTVCTAQTWTKEVAQAYLGLFGVELDKDEGSSLGFDEGKLKLTPHVYFRHDTWTEASAAARLDKLETVWSHHSTK